MRLQHDVLLCCLQGLLGPAGVAASTQSTGQQWDYPNAWPPLQDIIIEVFASTGGVPSSCCIKRPLHGAAACSHGMPSMVSDPLRVVYTQVPKGRY